MFTPQQIAFLERRIEQAGFGSFINPYFPNFKVQKITLATIAHTCPNRNPITGEVGCTYCNNASFTPNIETKTLPLNEQLSQGIDFFRYKYPTMRYLAYFQSYTSTFASCHKLIDLYQQALAYPGVVGLVVSTRPDMMPNALLDFLQQVAKEHFVLIEYGVESTINDTLNRVNRGHSYEQSIETIERTARRGIKIGAHLILGLPGETETDMLMHAEKLSALPIDILKLHQLQIIKGTPMAREYKANPEVFNLFTPQQYATLCLQFLLRLKPTIALDRFLSTSPADLLVAPRWNLKNYAFNAILRKQLEL